MARAASTLLLSAVLIVVASSAFHVEPVHAWSGVIIIETDGSVVPPGSPLHRVDDSYILTSDISSGSLGIVVKKDDLLLDGAGFRVEGTGISDSCGIYVEGRSNVTVRNLRISEFETGLINNKSSYNHFTRVAIENCLSAGLMLYESVGNGVFGCNITRNWNGIELHSNSNSNSICGNDIWSNIHVGIELCLSYNNSIYHNSFVDNLLQVSTCADLMNFWDNGYPNGGNFWGDHEGFDIYHGQYQNETGSDGLSDIQHVIDEDNADRYPLMGVWTESGENVTVHPSSAVSVTFDTVISGGVTLVDTSATGQDPPNGFQLAQPCIYYSIHTTANHSDFILLSMVYDGDSLMQLEEEDLAIVRWNFLAEEWENVTIGVDVENNIAVGETFSLSTFTIVIPLLGDINNDGIVDIYDAIQLAGAFGSRPSSANWNPDADINGDDTVDIYDAIIVARNYGKPGQS